MALLGFQEQIVSEAIAENGLAILASGLGLPRILAALVRFHSSSNGLLFLLSMPDEVRQALGDEIRAQDAAAELPIHINSQFTASERLEHYSGGGSFIITSRILVVDMLNERVPFQKVAGILVNNAHRMTESCTEAFIIRLLRMKNKNAYIRALSDQPRAMTAGFLKLERVMKSMFIRRLNLWPRFHLTISSALEEKPPEVVDIRVPLTTNMLGIQNAIVEVMDACLKELRKTNKVDVEDLTVDNGLFKSFDEIVRMQLDPIWHTIGRKTKQLVADLKTLRKLAEYLVSYDAVTFLKYLDTLRASESIRSVWIFAGPSHRIFELAKRRVYIIVRTDGTKAVESEAATSVSKGRGSKRKRNNEVRKDSSDVLDTEQKEQKEATQGVELEMNLEEMPKWKILKEVLEEIHEEQEKLAEDLSNVTTKLNGPVLVACRNERTSLQLQDLIAKGSQVLMREEWNKYLLGKAELHGLRMRGQRKRRPPKFQSGADDINSTQRLEQNAILAAATEAAALQKEEIEADENASSTKHVKRKTKSKRPTKNKAARKSAKGKIEAHFQKQVTENQAMPEDELVREIPEEEFLKELPTDIQDTEKKSIPQVHFYAMESNQRILESLSPSYVIVYDPDMRFVRELEVFKAQNPQMFFKVYFLFYEDSTEARKFEASINKENDAFESLIRQKASMMIPVDQNPEIQVQSPAGTFSTRKAGGRKAQEKQMQIVVDMREFGSSLPCVLHLQGMRILPVTLEVGDYILSPDICVERKSISDLYSSFASGRLYHQAETMTRYYRIPVLLIEFSQDKSFSFQSANDVGDDITAANIVSKMSLLVLHFPRLRIVWSRSLHATAEIFATLKANQDEPDIEKAMRVGVPTEDGLIEGDLRAENYNTSAVELLRRLPGVTDANYRSLMDGCKSMAELSMMTLEQLAEIMGGQRPARMLRDFLDAKCPTIQ